MGNNDQPLSREERLAAKLRENLRRRKAQKKALSSERNSPSGDDGDATLPKDESKS